MKRTVAVLFGGHSTEYDVSLQSAASVIENLDLEKYNVVLIGITRHGEWLKYGGGVDCIRDDTWHKHTSCVRAVISPDRATQGILAFSGNNVTEIHVDVVFPVLHGKNGEDGTVQGLLEMAGIPFVGCGMLSSALCMDKDVAHRLVSLAGVSVPRSMVVFPSIPDKELFEQTAHLKYPLFVKPANSGSSIGITKVYKQSELINALEIAFLHDRKVLVEEAVEGFEVGCAILGNDAPIVGEVDEIELTQGFFDYTEKYTLTTSTIHIPARIDKTTKERIRETAVLIYRTLGCKGFARVDLFLTPGKEIVFNEVNTIPGFTSHSRYPTMMKGIGMTFPQVIDELIRLAVEQ